MNELNNSEKNNFKEAGAGNIKYKLQKIFKSQIFFIILVIIAISIIASFINPKFLTNRNFFAVMQQISVLGILTMGQALLMISGGLDFSVGSIMSLVCVIVTKLVFLGYGVNLSVFVVVVIATLCGLINGIIIAKSKVMPIIITLGMLYVYFGIALVISGGRFSSFEGKFQLLGRGKIGIIPILVIVYILIFLFAFLLLKYTKYGRRLNIIGGNTQAAFLSGINVDLHIISMYALNGLIAGIAGLALASRLGVVLADVGAGYELKAVAACIIGGIALTGGRGSIVGAFFGVLLLGIIYNSMNIIGVTTYVQTIFLGSIIVITTVISNIGKMRR